MTQSAASLPDGAASSTSLDSGHLVDRELPPVDKKHDKWGREILIKNLKNGKYDITAGTVEALVESLAEEAPPDTIYIEVFLLTFRHFMTPVQLIKLLEARFKVDEPTPQACAIIRLRVVSVLKKWAERHYYDFRFPEMQTAFADFMKLVNESDCAKYGSQIKSILDAEMLRSKSFHEPLKIAPPPEMEKFFKSIDFVTAWSPKRVAIELTLVDLKLFRQIKPDEFCIFLWGEKNDPRISNFNQYVDRFNRIGFWVGSVVCAQKDIKRRIDVIEKYIQIMKYLLKFNNYSSLMALMSGLNTTGVSRLKKTWEQVEKGRYYSVYKDIEAKMSYKGNFKAYREIEAFSKPPFIPFFGLYVKDLTFMNDGNQKHLALKTETSTPIDPAAPPMPSVINFEKCRTITDKIHAIRIYQQSTYKFEEEKEEDGIFSMFQTTNNNGPSDVDLSIYFANPFGPPAIEDEKLLLEMSRECEASTRAPSSYVAGGTGTGSATSTAPRDPNAAGGASASASRDNNTLKPPTAVQ